MKTLLSLFLALAFAAGLQAQTVSKLEQQIKDIFGSINPGLMDQRAALTYGLIDTNGDLVLKATTGGNLVFEGATADAYELTLALPTLSADATLTIPTLSASSAFMVTTLTTNAVDVANSVWGASNGIVAEGATANGFETTLSFTDPTADRAIVFPNAAGTVLLTEVDQWVFEGSTADAFENTVATVDPTADGTVTLSDLGVGLADADVSFVYSTINAGLNAPGLGTAVHTSVNSVVFEGTTADASEAVLDVADPTADTIFRLPVAAAGTYGLVSSTLATNAADVANSVFGGTNQWIFEGATADAFETIITPTDATADRTLTTPNASGTVQISEASTAVSLTADDQAVTPGHNTILQLASDNATATNRTFTLSATGAITGGVYILIGPASNQCEIADTGIQKLSATWSPTANDTLTLVFDGTNFNEIGRVDN